MRLVVVSDFQCLRIGSPAPERIAVEEVDFEREDGVDGVEAEGPVILEEV